MSDPVKDTCTNLPNKFVSKSRYRTTHTRTIESKRKRNQAQRKKRKAMKRFLRQKREENSLCSQKKVLELTNKNKFLTRCIVDLKERMKSSKGNRANGSIRSISKSIIKNHASKSSQIFKHFNCRITEFKKDDIATSENHIGEGVFGKVNKGFIFSMNQRVAIKTFKLHSKQSDILAEASVASVMNGHINFPFLFGIVPEYCIVQEYVGSLEIAAPTLRQVLKNDSVTSSLYSWKNLLRDVSRAINDLHEKGILHNDLHANNILIRDGTLPKIIDFGKACLISNPVIYNIKIGSARHEKYNKIHRHLAHELRNIPGSAVSVETDVYTLGYVFNQVAIEIKNDNLMQTSKKMLLDCRHDRPSLLAVIFELDRLL